MSFVLVSPSTESWFQVRDSGALEAGVTGSAGATVASVSTIESIVAICGWIIPTPFAIPVTASPSPASPRDAASAGSSMVTVETFMTESVVRSASAAAARWVSLEPSAGRRRPQAPPRPVERQPRADDAGRQRQDVVDRDRGRRGDAGRRPPAGPRRRRLPWLRSRSRSSRRPRATSRCAPAPSGSVSARCRRRELDRCRCELVRREHGGRRGGSVRHHDEREIRPSARLDPGTRPRQR